VAIKPDVVIAGAGPAGSTAGYLLAGLGFRVLLLEKSEFPRYRVGESLTPSILSMLDFLKLRRTVEREEFLRMRMLGQPGAAGRRPARASAPLELRVEDRLRDARDRRPVLEVMGELAAIRSSPDEVTVSVPV
jgi:flavin-dependent dehydrogenase